MKEHLVFVYGTLKRGNPIRGLDRVRGSTFIGEAITLTSDYMMLDLGSFPGVIAVPGWFNATRIGGEVFSVTTDLLMKLDEIEGYPDFYDRMKVATTKGVAWMYCLASLEYAKFYQEEVADNVITIDGVTYWKG